jgi:hypothetical protein
MTTPNPSPPGQTKPRRSPADRGISTLDDLASLKYIVIFFVVAVLVGCASHQPKQQVVAPASSSFSHPTIIIVETNPVVYVAGEVMHPGRFIWTPDLALTNAISLAGGFTDFSDRQHLEIQRSHCDGTNMQIRYIRVEGLATNGLSLEQGDVVHVKRRIF